MGKKDTQIFKVTILKAQIFAIIGMLFFGYAAYASSRSAELWVPFAFMLFAVLSAYLLLFYGKIHIDAHGIRHYSLVGTYEICWDEITRIESSQGIYVLIGGSKQVSITDVTYWSGSEKTPAVEFFWKQIEERKIEMKQTAKALFKLSQNSRVN